MIIVLCKQKKLKKRIEAFLEGKDGKSLEEELLSYMEKVQIADKENKQLQGQFLYIDRCNLKLGCSRLFPPVVF